MKEDKRNEVLLYPRGYRAPDSRRGRSARGDRERQQGQKAFWRICCELEPKLCFVYRKIPDSLSRSLGFKYADLPRNPRMGYLECSRCLYL